MGGIEFELKNRDPVDVSFNVSVRAGGGSGGGSITIIYGSDTSSITPNANGGAAGAGNATGGRGGNGTARKLAA